MRARTSGAAFKTWLNRRKRKKKRRRKTLELIKGQEREREKERGEKIAPGSVVPFCVYFRTKRSPRIREKLTEKKMPRIHFVLCWIEVYIVSAFILPLYAPFSCLCSLK